MNIDHHLQQIQVEKPAQNSSHRDENLVVGEVGEVASDAFLFVKLLAWDIHWEASSHPRSKP